MTVPRVYWDTSCFISYLSAQHPAEYQRALVCRDILQHAQNDRVEIWTSAWTIVETIRPKQEFKLPALPKWAEALNQADKDGNLIYPDAADVLGKLWDYFHRHTVPTRNLSKEEAESVQAIFAYPFIRKISIEPTIATHAAQIARERNFRPGDSLHVASALARNCDCIHRWDRDYQKTDSLIPSTEPQMMTAQQELPGILPPPEPEAFRLN
jgi:predicted nucleic acid-binding protein